MGHGLLTERDVDGRVRFRPGRPALLVSCTSWTDDEDFSLLLDAVQQYDAALVHENSRSLPPILLVITGKGPRKAFYESQISTMKLTDCRVLTTWLKIEDYPCLLGSADLGISLHTSSSGLDLPMKVVDMLGSSLPVCAFDYPTLRELVHPPTNGFVFKTAAELTELWKSLLKDDRTCLRALAARVAENPLPGWDANWDSVARPLFETRL